MERVALHRVLGWFSCGAASAVALKLSPSAIPVYCETGSEHPDNERFLAACSLWFDRSVTRLRGEYASTWDVWQGERYLAGVNGAPCTRELKVKPRLEFQRPTDIHVFGYTADGSDVARANRLRENYPEMEVRTPLIERGLTKERCLSLVRAAGIELPAMYKLGFHNNNCIPCVKAQSPAYWALVRKRFPLEFNKLALLARELNVRLARIRGERAFIDDIPADQPTTDPIQPSCDFLCSAVEMEDAWSELK